MTSKNLLFYNQIQGLAMNLTPDSYEPSLHHECTMAKNPTTLLLQQLGDGSCQPFSCYRIASTYSCRVVEMVILTQIASPTVGQQPNWLCNLIPGEL